MNTTCIRPFSLVLVSFLLSRALTSADQIFITPEGAKHLKEITAALAPAPLLTSAQGQKYFCGTVLQVHEPPDLEAERNTFEGRPQWSVVAFAPDGSLRTEKPARLSEHWIRVKHQWDTFFDLRLLFSNRDQLLETDLGSKRFRESVNRAMYSDAANEETVSRTDVDGASTQLSEGAIIRIMRGNRLQGPELAELMNRWVQEKGLPVFANPQIVADIVVKSDVTEFSMDLLRLAARQRRYQVFESDIDEAATSMLAALCRHVDWHGVQSAPASTNGDDFVHIFKSNVQFGLVRAIQAAAPGFVNHHDDQQIYDLFQRLLTPDSPNLEQVKSQMQARIGHLRTHPEDGRPGTRFALIEGMQILPVDNSELASVAMDVIRTDESWLDATLHVVGEDISGTELVETDTFVLLEALVQFGGRPDYPDPRQLDRIPLKGKALTLIVHLINPPKLADPGKQARRQKIADANRDFLYHALLSPQYAAEYGESAFVRQALGSAGWKLSDRAKSTIDEVFDDARRAAIGILDRQKQLAEPTTPAEVAEQLPSEIEGLSKQLSDRFQTLQAIHALGQSQVEEERQVAAYLTPKFAELRREINEGLRVEEDAERLRYFLQLWEAIATP